MDVTYNTNQNPPQSTGSPRSQDEGIFFYLIYKFITQSRKAAGKKIITKRI